MDKSTPAIIRAVGRDQLDPDRCRAQKTQKSAVLAPQSAEKSWHPQVMDFDFTLAIDIPDLAAAIGANPRSARNAFYLRPQDFPPAIYLPGCRGPRFMVSDVLAWLESRKTQPAPPPPVTPKPKGRPRKACAAQIARARQGNGGVA
jgi:predicted DNA-binding transcriptional regulator AlpA